jgi:hypothetical protein
MLRIWRRSTRCGLFGAYGHNTTIETSISPHSRRPAAARVEMGLHDDLYANLSYAPPANVALRHRSVGKPDRCNSNLAKCDAVRDGDSSPAITNSVCERRQVVIRVGRNLQTAFDSAAPDAREDRLGASRARYSERVGPRGSQLMNSTLMFRGTPSLRAMP